MKVIGIIQARAGSTRLPNKIHLTLVENYSLLEFICSRVATVDIEWWLATTLDTNDNLTCSVGEKLGFRVFRGEQEDVLSRFLTIGRASNADWIVRITADNPFVDSDRIIELIETAIALPSDILVIGEDAEQPQFPIGYLPELVSFCGLEFTEANLIADIDFHKSNVTSFLKPQFLQGFKNNSLPFNPDLRWTIDEEPDVQMVRSILMKSTIPPVDLKYLDILAILGLNPEIQKINAGIVQKSFGAI